MTDVTQISISYYRQLQIWLAPNKKRVQENVCVPRHFL